MFFKILSSCNILWCSDGSSYIVAVYFPVPAVKVFNTLAMELRAVLMQTTVGKEELTCNLALNLLLSNPR